MAIDFLLEHEKMCAFGKAIKLWSLGLLMVSRQIIYLPLPPINMMHTTSVCGCSFQQLWLEWVGKVCTWWGRCKPHLIPNVVVWFSCWEGLGNGLTPGGRRSLGSLKITTFYLRKQGELQKCIFKQCFAFICINLENKIIWKWKADNMK